MFHLIVFITLYSLLFLFELSRNIEITLFIMSMVALIQFSRSEINRKKEELQRREVVGLEKKKEDLVCVKGIYRAHFNSNHPFLPDHTLVYFVVEGKIKHGYIRDELLLVEFINYKKDVRIYMEDIFILYLEK